MTSAQVVETSVNVISNSPSQDYTHPDDRTSLNDMTPGFKPFTIRENKITEGQIELDDRNNYQPLDKPMVRDRVQRVKHLINSLRQAGCIDEMTAKWFNQTPDPPRIPVFYTLTKIHKPTLVGRPIISGCDGLTERLSSFPSGVDKVLQPIAQIQESYLKDTTHFIRFIESTRVPKNAFLVSMDVTRLYTNIPLSQYSIPGGLDQDTNMAATSLFGDTNMAAVTSCELNPRIGPSFCMNFIFFTFFFA